MLKQFMDRIEKRLGNERQKKGFRVFLLLFSVGAGLMLISSFFSIEKNPSAVNEPVLGQKVEMTASTKETVMQQYEKEYQGQLQEILSKMAGVDDVTVMLNLDSSEEEVFALDTRETEQTTTERDKSGGNRSVNSTNVDRKIAHYRDNRGDQPVIIKRLKPKVRGVLVIARGVENFEVKAAVIEAVARILDVPIHRISVLPRG